MAAAEPLVSCLPWLSSLELRAPKIVITGPPCSGKTTFAHQHALAGDEIVDYDVIHAELTGLRSTSTTSRRSHAPSTRSAVARSPCARAG